MDRQNCDSIVGHGSAKISETEEDVKMDEPNLSTDRNPIEE